MLNPITEKKIYFFTYVLIWILFSIIQMSILLVYFELSFLQALTESLIVNFLHAVMGIAIWYPVRFNPVSARNFFNPMISVFATGIFTIAVWVSLSFVLLKMILGGDTHYLEYLYKSVPNRIVTDFLIYTVLVLMYSLIVYSSNLKEKIITESNLRTMVREAELNMLKSQINPHFLFNALNSISLLTRKDPLKAREMIIQLSDYLRYSLRFDEDSLISLNEEIDNMERYMEIEKIRFGEKLQYHKTINENSGSFLLPNMILQPLLENSIKHGVYESTEPVFIEIITHVKNNVLYIQIENDFDPENISVKGEGIGLKNVSARLQLIYNHPDLLKYSSQGKKFKVSVSIPSHKHLQL